MRRIVWLNRFPFTVAYIETPFHSGQAEIDHSIFRNVPSPFLCQTFPCQYFLFGTHSSFIPHSALPGPPKLPSEGAAFRIGTSAVIPLAVFTDSAGGLDS
jgi:hypothetical protein